MDQNNEKWLNKVLNCETELLELFEKVSKAANELGNEVIKTPRVDDPEQECSFTTETDPGEIYREITGNDPDNITIDNLKELVRIFTMTSAFRYYVTIDEYHEFTDLKNNDKFNNNKKLYDTNTNYFKIYVISQFSLFIGLHGNDTVLIEEAKKLKEQMENIINVMREETILNKNNTSLFTFEYIDYLNVENVLRMEFDINRFMKSIVFLGACITGFIINAGVLIPVAGGLIGLAIAGEFTGAMGGFEAGSNPFSVVVGYIIMCCSDSCVGVAQESKNLYHLLENKLIKVYHLDLRENKQKKEKRSIFRWGYGGNKKTRKRINKKKTRGKKRVKRVRTPVKKRKSHKKR